MPLYFFHVHDGIDRPDRTGTKLPDHKTARREATRMASALLDEEAETFWNGEEWSIDVTEEAGTIVFRLKFKAEQF